MGTIPSFQEQEEAAVTLSCLLIEKYTTSPPGIMGDFIRENVSKMDTSSLTFISGRLKKATFSEDVQHRWMELACAIGNEIYKR